VAEEDEDLITEHLEIDILDSLDSIIIGLLQISDCEKLFCVFFEGILNLDPLIALWVHVGRLELHHVLNSVRLLLAHGGVSINVVEIFRNRVIWGNLSYIDR